MNNRLKTPARVVMSRPFLPREIPSIGPAAPRSKGNATRGRRRGSRERSGGLDLERAIGGARAAARTHTNVDLPLRNRHGCPNPDSTRGAIGVPIASGSCRAGQECRSSTDVRHKCRSAFAQPAATAMAASVHRAARDAMTHLLQLLLLLAVIVMAAKLAGAAAARAGQPAVFGELLAGLLLGPTALNVLDWHAFAPIDAAPPLLYIVQDLADVGVILLMFVAGLETDVAELRRVGHVAFWSAAC